MENAAIAALPVADLADDSAHLYLWVTNPRLFKEERDEAGPIEILRAWGFRYITALTWHKLGAPGMGFYFRGDTEHVLFGIRGKAPIDPAIRVSNHFAAPRTVHSAKPDRFYEIVERVSPGPYLELFARRRRYGWDVWGNEAPPEQASQATLDLEGVA
jgi:N6-adenosine-specific RNA methylase IME4